MLPSLKDLKLSMKPSSLRISASRIVIREERVVTLSLPARAAFRIWVKKSAIKSVLFAIFVSPTRFDHARNHALIGQFTEADSAQGVAANIASGTAAHPATVITLHRKFGFSLLLDNETFFSHLLLLKWEAHELQKSLGLVLFFRRCHKSNIHPLDLFNFIEIHFWKDDLLLNSDAQISLSVKP